MRYFIFKAPCSRMRTLACERRRAKSACIPNGLARVRPYPLLAIPHLRQKTHPLPPPLTHSPNQPIPLSTIVGGGPATPIPSHGMAWGTGARCIAARNGRKAYRSHTHSLSLPLPHLSMHPLSILPPSIIHPPLPLMYSTNRSGGRAVARDAVVDVDEIVVGVALFH